MPMVIANFLRMVTSAKIFPRPNATKDAISAVDKILAEPGVALATLRAEWAALLELCIDKNLSGDGLPDAWLAAATAQMGEHWIPFDRDFEKLLRRSQVTVLVASQN